MGQAAAGQQAWDKQLQVKARLSLHFRQERSGHTGKYVYKESCLVGEREQKEN